MHGYPLLFFGGVGVRTVPVKRERTDSTVRQREYFSFNLQNSETTRQIYSSSSSSSIGGMHHLTAERNVTEGGRMQ